MPKLLTVIGEFASRLSRRSRALSRCNLRFWRFNCRFCDLSCLTCPRCCAFRLRTWRLVIFLVEVADEVRARFIEVCLWRVAVLRRVAVLVLLLGLLRYFCEHYAGQPSLFSGLLLSDFAMVCCNFWLNSGDYCSYFGSICRIRRPWRICLDSY